MSKSSLNKYLSIYPAIVRDVHDPMKSGRIKVECPTIYGVGVENWSPWALPLHQSHMWTVPLEGSTVWIQFRQGDFRYPMWVGAYTTYAPDSSPAEFQKLSEVSPYLDKTRDYIDHQNVYDNNDHKKGHEHSSNEFWNPYWHGFRAPLGSGFGIVEEPGYQATQFQDRLGQYLRFEGDPLLPVDPHDESRIGGVYTQYPVEELDNKSELYQTLTWRSRLRLQSTHEQFAEFRVRDKDKEEEFELQSANQDGTEGSSLLFTNSELGKGFLLKRFIPDHHQSYQSYIDPDMMNLSWQKVFDAHGQEWKINSDIDTPDKWFHFTNETGDIFRVEDDLRKMFWKDHNEQQIYFDTNEEAPDRHIEIFNAEGESIKLELDKKKLTIKDRINNILTMDPDNINMSMVDSHSQQLYFEGAAGNRSINLSNTAGESVLLEQDNQKLTIKDRSGSTILLDVGDSILSVTHSGGDSIVMNPSGTTVTAKGSTIEMLAAGTKVSSQGSTIDITASGTTVSSKGNTLTLTASGATISSSALKFTSGAPVTINGKTIAVFGDLTTGGDSLIASGG